MPKAVFLDRDGTVNREVDLLRDIKQLRLIPGAAAAIRELNRLGFLVIIITNQPVIARGWVSKRELDRIHALLARRLGRKGAKVDAIYYCPHHPHANLRRYRMRCSCRKPNIGLIRKAVKAFKIDVRRSFMIGDSTRDIETGRRAGLKTVLVKTGYAGKDRKYNVEPDFVARDMIQAVRFIKKHAE